MGTKLVGADSSGHREQGLFVDLSSDGRTVIVGGRNVEQSQAVGWIFGRAPARRRVVPR